MLGYFECSIQSSFLLFCKILVYVGFAMVNNSAVSIRLSIATYQFFFLSIMSGSSKLLDSDSRLYFPVIYGVIS